MSKIYLVEEKSGLGIFTIDFILLLLFAMGAGLNIILAFFAAVLASVVLFLLMRIPYFGRVVVCACGLTVTYCLYGVLNIFGWMTTLRENHPVQWWITIVVGGLVVIALHWIACPSPHSNGTILGDDEPLETSVPVYNYTPSDSIQNRYEGSTNSGAICINLDDIISVFNKTKDRMQSLIDKSGDYAKNQALPQEYRDVFKSTLEKYDALENRMRSFLDLFDESSDSWRDEVGADILKKAEAANAAIEQMESAFRLLSQASDKGDKGAYSEASFFRGCNTPEELTKRYRNLTKTFHPDLEAGDEETMKQVNEEYERLKSELASKK